MIVGLLGGVASGKSTVARLLGERGARVVDADRIAHGVLESPAVAGAVAAVFGADALDPDGKPDRTRIGAVAFADPEKLRALQAIVHPRVRERIRAEIEAAAGAPALVIDAPLLLEGGLAEIADVLVYVDAPVEARRERAARDRGWAPAELDRREERQAALADKRRAARHEIRNDGTLEELEANVAALWEEIRRATEDRSNG